MEIMLEGKFWTQQNEMIEEVESLGYKVIEFDGDYLVVVDFQDETEHILHVGRANRTILIESAE